MFNRRPQVIYRIFLAILIIWLSACSQDNTPESRIIALIKEGELAAEEHNLGFFKDVLSPYYSDTQGLSRDELLHMLAGYFYRNRTIHLISRTEEVLIEDDGRARVIVLVGMAGSPVEGFEQLLTLRADLYQLELEISLTDDIRIEHARWERVKPEELF